MSFAWAEAVFYWFQGDSDFLGQDNDWKVPRFPDGLSYFPSEPRDRARHWEVKRKVASVMIGRARTASFSALTRVCSAQGGQSVPQSEGTGCGHAEHRAGAGSPQDTGSF
jgi:hypothetical protein